MSKKLFISLFAPLLVTAALAAMTSRGVGGMRCAWQMSLLHKRSRRE